MYCRCHRRYDDGAPAWFIIINTARRRASKTRQHTSDTIVMLAVICPSPMDICRSTGFGLRTEMCPRGQILRLEDPRRQNAVALASSIMSLALALTIKSLVTTLA